MFQLRPDEWVRTEQQARAWPTRAPAKSRGLEWIRSHESEEDEVREMGRGQARHDLVSAGGDFELHSPSTPPSHPLCHLSLKPAQKERVQLPIS